jgi:hypothetical protein
MVTIANVANGLFPMTFQHFMFSQDILTKAAYHITEAKYVTTLAELLIHLM